MHFKRRTLHNLKYRYKLKLLTFSKPQSRGWNSCDRLHDSHKPPTCVDFIHLYTMCHLTLISPLHSPIMRKAECCVKWRVKTPFDGTRQPRVQRLPKDSFSQAQLAIISRLHKIKKNFMTCERWDVDTFLTSLQPVVSLSAVRHQGSRWPQALLAEHRVALPDGQEEDDHQHTAQYTYQPPPHRKLTILPGEQGQVARNKQQGLRKGGGKKSKKRGLGKAGSKGWRKQTEKRDEKLSVNCRGRDDWNEWWRGGLMHFKEKSKTI